MKQSGFGIASLILGIISIVTVCIVIGIIPAILGVIFAIVAFCQKNVKKEAAIVGFVCSLMGIILFIAIAIIANGGDSSKTDSETVAITQEAVEEVEKDEKESATESIVEPESQPNSSQPQEQPSTPAQEILFCNIPWGTSFTEVKNDLGELGLWGIAGEDYKTMSVDDIVLGDYQGIDFECSDINIIGNCQNDEVEVAGYTTTDVQLFFAYIPVDGILTKEEQDSALYGARYEFETQNINEMYEDLTQKLSLLYGEPSKTMTDSDLFGNSYKYTYWYGLNDTMVVLKYLDSGNEITDVFSDTIYICYVWNEGDRLLQQASDILKQEAINNEKAIYGNNDTSGL